MPRADIVRSCHVIRSARVMQLEGMFDVQPSETSAQTWKVDFDLPTEWNIGVIVGPSGSGKSTLARELFAAHLVTDHEWDSSRSVLDGFAPELSIKEIVGLLSSVGFSSPPSWLRPFHVLSNGEKFRVTMARALAESREMCVIDEFTSVLDRVVAKIGSAAIAKTVRRREQRLIVCACHYDIVEWLEPDWIYEPHVNQFRLTGRLQRRPEIKLEIKRVHSSAWKLFKRHHYMSDDLNKSAQCFVAWFEGVPVAFTSYLHFPHASDATFKREHRTVVLPDFQGIGIGNRLSEWCGDKLTNEGFRFVSTTSAPSMIWHRKKSPLWRVHRSGNSSSSSSSSMRATLSCARLSVGFEYIGNA